MRILIVTLAAAAAAAAAAGIGSPACAGTLEVRIEKLRNIRGVIHLCLTGSVSAFPDCAKDPNAIRRTVPAGEAALIRVEAVKPGAYALAIFHDENGNKKLDTFLGIPREGYGFSQNPIVRFGPPSFAQSRFTVDSGIARVTIRMQYVI